MLKHILRSLIVNGVFLAGLYFLGYVYPQYAWSVKTTLYIMTTLCILGAWWYIKNPEEITERLIKKYKSSLYLIIDFILDLLFLAAFVLLDYKVLFVFYLVYVYVVFAMGIKIRKYYQEADNGKNKK